MLEITFTPSEEREDIIFATGVYQRIWNSEGARIVEVIENITGLQFRESKINATVHEGNSRSEPLFFNFRNKSTGKRAALVHELIHRLFYSQGVDKNQVRDNKLESHRILYLVLYDVWDEIYDKEFADRAGGN